MRTLVFAGILGTTAVASAADPAPSQADITQVAGMYGTTCVLHTDGAVSCWGSNANNQLAAGGTHTRLAPIDVPELRGAVQIAGVRFGICGRFSDGTVTCLGSPGGKQSVTDVVELRGDCARMKSGSVSCVAPKTNVWTPIAGITDAVSVDGELDGGCVVHADATVSCWGHDLHGTPTLGAAADGSAKRIDKVSKAVEVAVGMHHACARTTAGQVMCWGINASGELGRGTVDSTLSYQYFTPARVVGLADATRIFGAAASVCAIRKTGALVCWGKFYWKRGDNVKDTFTKPTVIAGIKGARDFMSSDHYCVVGKGREVRCWGANRFGQLGLGYEERLPAARDVPAISDAISVHGLALGTCVLRKSGALECFGLRLARKQPGAPKLTHLSSFQDKLTGLDRDGKLWMGSDQGARAIAGTAHDGACVVTKAGTVTCRAAIMYSRARTGTVKNVTDAVEVAGETRICIRHKTGHVSCLHISQAIGSGEATRVPTIDDAIAIATSERESCAVRADRSVWCWGDGDSEFLGGKPTPLSANKRPDPIAPFKVPGLSDVAQLSLGRDTVDTTETACAVTMKGRVLCWGVPNDTYKGVLDTANKPVEIAGITDAVQVSLGWLHACAVRKTGGVACWGSTGLGQSGTLPTDSVETPQLVPWPAP